MVSVTVGDVMSHWQKLQAGGYVTVSRGINCLLITTEKHDLQLDLSMKCACLLH